MKISWRIWALIIILVFSLLSIGFSFQKGVVIKSVEHNSTAFNEGLRQGEIIKEINGQKVESRDDYARVIDNIFAGQRLLKGIELTQIINKTNKTDNGLNIAESNITSDIKEAESDLISVRIKTKNKEVILFDNEPPKIVVDNIPRTKLRTGLDISGGARAVVKPERDLSRAEIDDLIAVTRNRLNVFGISDVTIRAVSDLAGNNFMLIEVAGATPSDLQELVAKQGKFEARIGNETAFVGGNKDITNVCRNDASCSGIYSCNRFEQGYICQFRFVIYLSEAAAQKHANITEKLDVNVTDVNEQYLEKPLDLYLDDNLVDSLLISEDLKGRVTTQIQIQGSGTGTSQQEAYNEAAAQMNKLQTVLITGSLPFKLEIVKLDSISPILGEEFIRNILIAGLFSILVVSLIVFIRYRNIKISLAILLTSFSEIIIILGIAAFIKWNLDLPSIAGILVTIGTGVDQQIVIIDESRAKKQTRGLKERMKRAFFIVVSAFFTSIASLLPLNWAGGGLLRGFAITTIIGISAGVLITRPAFIEIIKRIEEKIV